MVTTNVIALFVLFLSYVQLQYMIEQERYPFWRFTTLPPAKPLKTGFPYLIYTCFSFLSFLWLFKWMGSLFEIETVEPVCITDNYDHIFLQKDETVLSCFCSFCASFLEVNLQILKQRM